MQLQVPSLHDGYAHVQALIDKASFITCSSCSIWCLTTLIKESSKLHEIEKLNVHQLEMQNV